MSANTEPLRRETMLKKYSYEKEAKRSTTSEKERQRPLSAGATAGHLIYPVSEKKPYKEARLSRTEEPYGMRERTGPEPLKRPQSTEVTKKKKKGAIPSTN